MEDLGFDNLRTSLERQLASMLTDNMRRRRTSTARTIRREPRTSTVTSSDILSIIREHHQNMERYQANMDALIRLLSRTIQNEREPSSPPIVRHNWFTFFNDNLAAETPVETRLSSQQIRDETQTILFDISNAQHQVCPISLEDFVQGEVITQICGCGHIFKTDFLMRWLERQNYCPVCRYSLLHRRDASNNTVHSNPVGDYDIVQNEEGSDDDNTEQFTFEIPILFDTSNNHILSPENGQRATSRQLEAWFRGELMNALYNRSR